MAGFCHKAVVFWTAFSDARFAPAWPKRVGITSDSQQHLINKCGDCSGLVFGPACGVGELAHGVQAAFEGEALEVDVVGECCFLHDAADEVVGDKMHAQFPFNHGWSQAPQHIHVEMDFYLAEMEFDIPPSEVESDEIRGGNGGIKDCGHERDASGAKSALGDGVANDAHGDTFRQQSKLFGRLRGSALRGAFPSYHHIEGVCCGEKRADGLADLCFRQAHE